MIESDRTGDFQPRAHVYESYDTLDTSSCFGIDLRKWSGQQSWKSVVKAGDPKSGATVPAVLTAMLQAIEAKQKVASSDDEKRKAWIYVVQLKEVHQLRNRINDALLPVDAMVSEIQSFNLPVMAAAVKLWLLELSPPLLGAETHAVCKEAYGKNDAAQDLPHLLSQTAGAQIFVLDAIVGHLRRLIDSTTTQESDSVYITKLGLSLGRAIMRSDNDVSLRDHTASRLLADLITHYHDVFPELLQRARRVVERPMPVRKRTRPVDERMIRSKLQQDGDHEQQSSDEQSARRSVDVKSESAMRTEKLPEEMVQAGALDEQQSDKPPAFADPKLDVTTPAPAEESPPAFAPPQLESAPKLGSPIVELEPPADSDDRPPTFAPPKLDKEVVAQELPVEDRPVQEGAATVNRSGSGETTGRLVRGPRGELLAFAFTSECLPLRYRCQSRLPVDPDLSLVDPQGPTRRLPSPSRTVSPI